MRKRQGVAVLVLAIAAAMVGPGQAAGRGHDGVQAKPAPKTTAPAASGNAQAEKTLVANERAVIEAVAKADAAGFKQHVAAESWSIDPMAGRMSTAMFLEQFDQMAKDMKMTSWDITDVQTLWVNPNVAVLTYKWTGQGTYQGQPIPSPTWASTVWARRNGKWVALFHQESAAPPAK
jgi:hypothetical protein